MTLFYIGGYSMDEVATFLEVPVSTIKGRLHSARERLRTMLLDTVADDLRARRPSRNESFATTVVDLLQAARAGDIERVKTLLKADPRLLVARDPMGNTALIIAVNSGHEALADLLFDAGVEPGLHEAAAIGDSGRVRAALDRASRTARHVFAGRLHAAGPGRAFRSPRGHAAADRSRCRRESRGHASDRGDAAPCRAVWTAGGRRAAPHRTRRRRHARARWVRLEARRLDAVALRGRHGLQHARAAAARSRCGSLSCRTRKERRRSMSRSTRITTTLPTFSVHEVRNDDDPSSDDGDGHGTNRSSQRDPASQVSGQQRTRRRTAQERRDAEHLRGCGDGPDRARAGTARRESRRSSTPTHRMDSIHWAWRRSSATRRRSKRCCRRAPT